MTRFLQCLALMLPLCFALVGCGSGSGEATFDPSTVEPVSAEEQSDADDYEKMMKEQSKNYGKQGG